MKKTLAIFLGAALMLSVVLFSGCGSEEADSLRFGTGIVSSMEVTNASEDKNGNGTVSVTVATVLLDKNNRIAACILDCSENSVSYTANGNAVANEALPTKREQGDSYGMKAYGGALKEWYEEADAFSSLTVGKTVEEVKAMVAENGKGNDEVIRAGCTISVTDFVKAIEKAVQNASVATAASETRS
jgi:hypothetical protein